MKVDKSKWEKLTFSQIGKSQLGKTLDSKRNMGKPYPYLCAVNVGYGNFNLSNIKEILLEEDELDKYLVKKGDLLICEGGDTGRCAIWESDKPIYYQNALHRVRFKDGINNRFIMYAMHYLKLNGTIDRYSHGQTIKHLTQKGLNKLVFNVPNITVQQTIASEFDAVQEMIDGYKAQLEDLDALAQSIFLDTFGDPITNPKGWAKEIFEDVISLKSGDSLSAKQMIPGEYPVYGGNGINGFHNDFNKNGVYIVIGRVGAYCGNVRLVKGKFWLTDNAFELINKKNKFDYTFQTFLLSNLKLGNMAHKAAQPVISNIVLRGIEIIIPPIELQQHFASQVEAIEKQKDLLREQLKDAETLMAERMQYYFS